MKFAFLITCIALLTFSSCELVNPDEPIPGYIHCDSISFQAESSQGSSSSAIKDAWVYVDGKIQGTYELPAHFPVLAEGVHTISISPGILVNGISSSRGAYPFYSAFDTILNIEPGKSYSVAPRSAYLGSTQFLQIEDFDQTGTTLTRAAASDTSLNIISDQNAFEILSGAVFLDTDHSYFEYASTNPFVIAAGRTAYAELNYKCSNEFLVGLTAVTSSQEYKTDILYIRPAATWKKIYVNLSDIVSANPGATGFKLYIAASLASGASSGDIYLDNIKVLR